MLYSSCKSRLLEEVEKDYHLEIAKKVTDRYTDRYRDRELHNTVSYSVAAEVMLCVILNTFPFNLF